MILSLAIPDWRDDGACAEPDIAVADFPQFKFSKKDVLRAGEALAGNIPWNNEQEAQSAREIFQIAHNWRDSHAYPMRRMRYELAGQIRKLSGKATLPVARLKRMPSIRRKLVKHPGNLNQIQDLAGCRAIMPTVAEANSLIEAMRANSAHEVFREYPYMSEPKPDGYRCHHMVFKFRGTGDEAVFDGRRIEIQIRSELQHSWATAVEAVGLFRREDLKAGQGNPDWLRLFVIMSEVFAVEENLKPADDLNVAEIVELEKKLDAVDVLERLSQAFSFTENYVFNANDKPDYFLIEYDRAAERVSIRPFFGPIYASMSYDSAEVDNAKAGSRDKKTVLVEVDGIENLKSAYPNYFGDVHKFKDRLRDITKHRTLDYSVPPQERVPIPRREKPDLSWLSGYRRWK
jgi:hypothetical protein